MNKFEKSYTINSSQCDKNGQLRLRTLFNMFQDLADFHADKMGLGYHFCTPLQIGWIGGGYHLQINRMPLWEDEVVLYTWPSDKTAVTGIREFQMQDKKGNVLINASSQWVLVDTQKMRPIAVSKHIGSYELIPERTIKTSFETLPIVERTDTNTIVSIRRDDIDINNHVNNAVYPTLALDGLTDDFLNTHVLAELEISFKRPAKWGDCVEIKTQMDELSSIHQILNVKDDTELARLKLGWNVKEA